MRKTLVLVLTLSLLAGVSAALAQTVEDKSDNVTLEASFPYTINDADPYFSSGTDIDFSGKYIYAMQQGGTTGGVHILKASKKSVKEVAFFACPGEQNDVAVVKPGLIAIGYHTSTCGGVANGVGEGMQLVDVKNPKRPKLLGSVNVAGGPPGSSAGAHTLTVYPGTNYVYLSPGGLPTNGGGISHIVDVSDPMKPEVVATFTPNPSGCHDFSFYIAEDMKLGFCPGLGETQILDVSDPLAPEMLGHIVNPTNELQHTAYTTSDGEYLAVTDEAEASDCAGGPKGNVWLYDISSPQTPLLAGTFDPQRGSALSSNNNSPATGRSTWCSAHQGGFIPGTYQLVLSWYSSGFDVIDFTDPMAPEEIAYYDGDESNYWSAYWHDGRIYANDREFGKLDVFKVEGLAEGKL